MAGEIPGLRVVVEIDTSGVTAGVSKVKEGLSSISADAEKTGGKMRELKDLMLGVFGGNLLTSGVMGLEKTLTDMNLAVQDAQVESGRLATALKNTGNATEANTKLVEDNVKSYANLGFTHAQAAQAMGTLVTATGSVSESTKLMAMAADLARYKHEDLNTAATTLARGTQGSVKAFKELGITLDSSLPKNQAIAKAFDELNGKIGGQATAYTHTFAGEIAVLKEKFNEIAVTIGNVVFPVITKIIGAFNAVFNALKPFSGEILFLTGAIGGAILAYKAWQAVTTGIEMVQRGYMVTMTLLKGAKLEDVVATEAQTASQKALNFVLQQNPWAKVIEVIALVVGALVTLYNHNQRVRDILISVAEAGIKSFGWIIQIIGDTIKIILELVTGPMHLLLEGLAFIHAPGAKQALTDLNGAIQGVSNWFDKAATSVYNYSNQLDQYRKMASKSKDATTPPTDLSGITGSVPGGDTVKGAAAAAKKLAAQLAKDQADAKKIYGEMNTDLATYQTDAKKLQTTWQKDTDSAYQAFYARNEVAQDAYNKTLASLQRTHDNAMEDAQRRHNEAMASAQQSYDNSVYDAQRSFNQSMASANATYAESVTKAQTAYSDTLATINDTYNQAVLDANTANQQKILDLQTANNDAVAKLQQSAADKQLSIVQKSKDLLINEFANVTKINLSTSFFGGGGTALGLVGNLQKQLDDAQKLQQDAAALAGKGYTQTFIQEVIKQGPYVGDQMAKSILNATPETAAQIQALYGQVQDVSQNGMNALADQMNSGASLATQALTQEYQQVTTDLNTALAAQAEILQDNLAKQQTAYQASMNKAADARATSTASANKTLTDALATAQDSLNKATASATQTLNDALFNANRTLVQAQAAAKQTLDDALATENRSLKQGTADADATLKKALADSQTTLQDALTTAQTTYDTAIQALNDATMAKITKLQTQLKTVADLIAKIQGASAAVGIMAASPGAGYIAGTTTLTPPAFTPTVPPTGATTNITVNGYNLTNPQTTAQGINAIIQNGQTQGIIPAAGQPIVGTGSQKLVYG